MVDREAVAPDRSNETEGAVAATRVYSTPARVTMDVSPAVHARAGLGRHAGSLFEAIDALDDPRIRLEAFYAEAATARPERAIARRPRHSSRLGYKPWRLAAMASHFLRRPMDHVYGAPALIHATDHLLPRLRARSLFTLHDLIFERYPEHHRRYNYTFLKLMMPRFLRAADHIVTVSEVTRRDATALYGIDPARMTVVHNGVEPRYRPLAATGERARLADRYGLPERYLLHVGTIEPRKNLTLLLSIFPELVADDPDLYLVLVGKKGWLYEPFFDALAASGLEERVKLPGYVEEEDLPALYRQATVFVYPSVYEGFGLPPLEALASGTPVVSSSASSLPEVVGDAALLADPHDPRAFRTAIRRVLDDDTLREELAARGPIRAARFTWEAAARKTVALYARLLGIEDSESGSST